MRNLHAKFTSIVGIIQNLGKMTSIIDFSATKDVIIKVSFYSHFCRFEEYCTPLQSGKNVKKAQLSKLQEQLSNKSGLVGKLRIWITFPLPSSHQFHTISVESGLANRIDSRVQDKIYEYVGDGVISGPLIRKSLRAFVQRELITPEEEPPHPFDRRYFPTSRDIKNHIHNALLAGRYAHLDQDNLEALISEWQSSNPLAFYHLRKATTTANEECSLQSSFLFVHQEDWQKKLLVKYGNTLCLMDATYKTTKYALPLFFLGVRTNVDYTPVATFITEDESSENVAEALQLILQQNPAWNPPSFMVDYSESEINAIKRVFPNAKVYLCSFHREQAWERWSKTGKAKFSFRK